MPSAGCLSSSSWLSGASACPQLVLCMQLSKSWLGKGLLGPEPGREAACTLLGCKHTGGLFLYVFPAVELGLLLNYQKYWNARHESCTWPAPGASPASSLCPRGAAKVPREESWQLLSLKEATIATAAESERSHHSYSCRTCLARSAELHSSDRQS